MSKLTKSRGSIMIWTLLLGISLATVFFFFSQRLNANSASQRATIKYQNARMLLNSYADYIEGLSKSDLETLRGDIDFAGMTGTLTNEAESVTDILDAGDNISFSAKIPAPASDNIKIEWDECPKNDTEILEITPPAVSSDEGCPALSYENAAQTTDNSFTLTATAGPTHYKLTKIGDAVLYDNKWRLDLAMDLGFRKKLTTNSTFLPDS